MVVTSKATMKQANVRFNYDDYLQLPEDKRYEILDGELCVVPAPSVRHQRIFRDLLGILSHYAREQRLGEFLGAPCDVILSEENVVQPDIFFVGKERFGIIGKLNAENRGRFQVLMASALILYSFEIVAYASSLITRS